MIERVSGRTARWVGLFPLVIVISVICLEAYWPRIAQCGVIVISVISLGAYWPRIAQCGVIVYRKPDTRLLRGWE